MNEVYVIQSDSGDEYKLQFTTERSGFIAEELLDLILHTFRSLNEQTEG